MNVTKGQGITRVIRQHCCIKEHMGLDMGADSEFPYLIHNLSFKQERKSDMQ
jgi:hypothetical protein